MKHNRIAFLCEVPEDYWTFFPLMQRVPGAELVIVPLIRRQAAAAKIVMEKISSLATQAHLSYRVFDPKSDWIVDFFAPYDLIVGTNLEGYFGHPGLTLKKKLLFCEQAASWPGTVSFSRAGRVDAIAAPGPYCAAAFEMSAPTGIVGSPRLEAAAAHANAQGTPSILYAPSSHNPRFRKTISIVADATPISHRLIVLVPTLRETWRDFGAITNKQRMPELVFWGEAEPAALVAAADAVIIEDLSLVLDCLFFDTPMVLLDLVFGRQSTSRDLFVPPATTRTFHEGDPTLADIGVIVRMPRNLPAALAQALELNTQTSVVERRNAIARMMLARPPEGAAASAAAFIQDVCDMPRKTDENFLSRVSQYQCALERASERLDIHGGTLTRLIMRLLKTIEP